MQFKTYYGKHYENYSNAGDRMQIEYELVITKDGREELQKTGMTDIQEFIDSHLESVLLQNIIARYQAGDTEALEKVKGFYADVKDMPSNFAEVMNLGIKGKQFFDKLPVEVKKLYNNNYMEFLLEPQRLEKLNKVNEDKEDEVLKDDHEEH